MALPSVNDPATLGISNEELPDESCRATDRKGRSRKETEDADYGNARLRFERRDNTSRTLHQRFHMCVWEITVT